MPGTPSFGSPRFGSPPGSPGPPAPAAAAEASSCEPSPTFGSTETEKEVKLLAPRPPCSTPRRGSNPEPEVIDELTAAVPLESCGGMSPGGTQKYRFLFNIGQGSYGVVYVAEARDGRKVAVKCVEPDEGREMREVELLETIDHPNVVRLLESFAAPTSDGKKMLHIIMDYLPKNLHDHLGGQPVDVGSLRCYGFQLLRALAALDALSICHRDVKPENVVLDPAHRVLKLCDFGSAKRLGSSSASIPYICARWWRAPELVLGSTLYRTSVDWWSAGCVLAEMMRGKPLFAGQTSWGQIGEIARVLGIPTDADIRELVPEGLAPHVLTDLTQLRQSPTRTISLQELLPRFASCREAMELLQRLLVYNPALRLTPSRSLGSELFAKLPFEAATLPPTLFQFSAQELSTFDPSVAQGLKGLSQRAAEFTPSSNMSFSLG
mmetsp:Transcript_16840/g.39103  ORF Transcript_16840/g.39103 Transcript_16840/m.39103 type:complete len:436 (-) Transcript_16840:31-1338(-)